MQQTAFWQLSLTKLVHLIYREIPKHSKFMTYKSVKVSFDQNMFKGSQVFV